MKRTVSAGEMGGRLSELLEGVFSQHDEVVIEEGGKPMAVVIPAYLYQSIERGREQIVGLIQKSRERSMEPPAPSIFEQSIFHKAELVDGDSAETMLGEEDVIDAGGEATEEAAAAEPASLTTALQLLVEPRSEVISGAKSGGGKRVRNRRNDVGEAGHGVEAG